MANIAVSAPITTGSITATANSVTVTSPTINVNNPSNAGVLIKVFLSWTPSATQTITAKLYQVATTGTQVNPSAGLLVTATGTTGESKCFEFVDTSAFANNTQGAVWVCGFTASSATTGTVVYSFLEIMLLGPIQ
jgi:hypothetical protein